MPSRGLARYQNILMSLYAAGFLLVITPLVDFIQNVWPIQLSVLNWRFGTVGLFAGFLLTPLLGLLTILLAAVTLGHRKVLRTFAFLSLAVALVLFVLLAVFVLDAFQVRGSVRAEMKTAFDTTGIKAVAKYLTGGLVFGWIGLAILWDLGGQSQAAPERERDETPEKALIVGR